MLGAGTAAPCPYIGHKANHVEARFRKRALHELGSKTNAKDWRSMLRHYKGQDAAFGLGALKRRPYTDR
jgi:hypothetical protein